jgi:uncharacterized membrane protein
MLTSILTIPNMLKKLGFLTMNFCRLLAFAKLPALLLFTLFIGVVSTSNHAHAKLEICNETDLQRDIAIGYKADGNWTSEGWWKLDVGECTSVIKKELTSTFYYYRAVHKGKEFDPGKFAFCTQGDVFTIVGDEDCDNRGYDRSFFRELKLAKGTLGFRLTLNNENVYDEGRPTAKAQPAPKPAPAPAPQIAAPGTHGEPFTIVGIFRGCDSDSGPYMCTFETDGWRYAVIDDGRTPKSLINEMSRLPLNNNYQIEGDIVSFGDITAEVTVRRYSEVALSAEQKLMNSIVGDWRSVDDPKEVMRFTSDFRKWDEYDGDYQGEGEVSFTKVCDDPTVLPGDEFLIQINDANSAEDIYCYGIIDISDNNLVLMFLPRGNFLEYERDTTPN